MVYQRMTTWIGTLMNRTRRDYSAMLQDPTSSSLIMAVVLWMVRRWPEAPIYLEDANEEPQYRHPMLEKIQYPNKFYGGNILWWGTIMSLVWDGNGYWVKVRDKQLRVVELWYVPHFMIRPMINNASTNFIDYYMYSPGGQQIQLDPSDVVHFRYGIDPYDPRKGMSPLKSIARDAVSDEEADNFSTSLLLNLGVPGLMLTPDPTIIAALGSSPSDEDTKALKSYLKENFSNDKRGEPLVSAGPWKIQQFGLSPKDMDLSSLRGISEERITAVTGVPAAVVGFGSGLAQTKVGATMKELREMAYEDAIIPMQRLIGPELKTQLLDDYEKNPQEWNVCFDLSNVRVLQEDQNALHTRATADFNGGLTTLNQSLMMIGEESVANGDVRRIPFNMTEIPIGQTGQSVTSTEPSAPVVPAKGDQGVYKFLLAHNCAEHKQAELKGWKPAPRSKLVQAFLNSVNRIHNETSAKYTLILEKGFSNVAQRAVEAFNYLNENGQLNFEARPTKADNGLSDADLMAIEIDAHNILMQMTESGDLSNELAWKAQYLSITQTMYEDIKVVYGVSFNFPDPAMQEVVAKGGKHIALVGLNAQTQDAIFAALSDAKALGVGPIEAARLIRSNVEGKALFPGMYSDAIDSAVARGFSEEKATAYADKIVKQYRAQVISRTEMKYAQNVSTTEIAKSSGTFNAMQLVDGQLGPPRSCEICLARDGEIVDFAQAEVLSSEEHPQGTMSMIPIIQ